MKKFYFLFIIFILFSASLAQNIEGQIKSLENDLKAFKYHRVIEKGNFLLGDSFTSKKDSLIIYQFMLSSSYALNDTILAKTIISDILKCQPQFALDPNRTSPKIIELFNLVKKQVNHQSVITGPAEPFSGDSTQTISFPVSPFASIASVILPGSGHLLNGEKKSGTYTTAVSVLLAAGGIYSLIQTSDKRDLYMSARGDASYQSLYDDYNSSYKIRNMMLIGYGLWSLYNLYDLHKDNKVTVNLSPRKNGMSLSFTKSF